MAILYRKTVRNRRKVTVHELLVMDEPSYEGEEMHIVQIILSN
jgi:hypothetical protein